MASGARSPGSSPKRTLTVAIDGPAGAGKSTVSKTVARALGYTLVDTGAIYRAVALLAQRRGVSWDDELGLEAVVRNLEIDFRLDNGTNRVWVNGEEVTDVIRTPQMDQGASKVSSHMRVRQGLLALQRRLAGRGGAVLEGRDIGTVVCPDAEVKVFLDASVEERARRRFRELEKRGETPGYEQVLADVRARDSRDRQREHAPLRIADDAVVLDCTQLTPQQAARRVVELAQQAD